MQFFASSIQSDCIPGIYLSEYPGLSLPQIIGYAAPELEDQN